MKMWLLLSAVLGVCLSATPALSAEKKVLVFVLAGQSNMVGHGKVEMGLNPEYKPGEKGTPREIKGGKAGLRYLVSNPDTAETFEHLVDADGKWVEREDVWIYSTAPGKETGKLTVGFGKGSWFGPELGFGHEVGDAVDQPVLLIKTAWGGHSLGVKFRPPSSGDPDYKKSKFKAEDVGSSYRQMLEIVKDITGNLGKHFPELKDHTPEFAGFGWHQGWNDMIDEEKVDEYEENLCNLIRDVRKDLGAPKLPFVIANTGMVGPEATGNGKRLCEIQLAVGDPEKHPEFAGTVASVDTRPFKRGNDQSPSHFGYHWNHNGESHYLVGQAMGEAMVKLLEKRE